MEVTIVDAEKKPMRIGDRVRADDGRKGTLLRLNTQRAKNRVWIVDVDGSETVIKESQLTPAPGRGGARPGTGRKDVTARRVMLKLDVEHAALLERLEEERDESASDVLRAGLQALAAEAER